MVVHKPPMGFNTWNTFGEKIDEKMLRQMADALVDTGLRDLGYVYLVIDDCWSLKKRDKDGKLVPDPKKFPNGMKAVADYVHSKGLKFGMYSCAGAMTCAGYPGSYRHEYTDAQTFADWGVDFLKYDYCYHSKSTVGADSYRKMAIALKNTGRDILFSACSWGYDETAQWIDTTGANMWRATLDIRDSWGQVKELAQIGLSMDGKNFMNCFTDLDMLVVGMKGTGFCALEGCTQQEYITHFSFWSMFGSPLMIGCDIRKADEDTLRILGNKEVIAINQDSECNRPFQLMSTDVMEYTPEQPVFAKILENGDVALAFFNFADAPVENRYITLDMLGMDSDIPMQVTVRDLWTGEEFEPANDIICPGKIEPHACRLFRIRIH